MSLKEMRVQGDTQVTGLRDRAMFLQVIKRSYRRSSFLKIKYTLFFLNYAQGTLTEISFESNQFLSVTSYRYQSSKASGLSICSWIIQN